LRVSLFFAKIQVIFFERVLLFTTVLVIKPHNTAESVFFIAEIFVKLTLDVETVQVPEVSVLQIDPHVLRDKSVSIFVAVAIEKIIPAFDEKVL
jgi:hypothetical protein